MSAEAKTATRDALLARGVSQFTRVTSTRPTANTSLRRVLDGIRDGQWQREVADLRETYRMEGKEAYKKARAARLELFTPSGICRERNNGGLTDHSGIVALDFDNLGEKLAATKTQLIQDGRALCIFDSPSGDGLKVLVPVDSTDAETHRAAYSAALQQFSHLGVAADTSCRDPARLCFVSYDPDIWVNPSSSLSLLSAPVPASVPVPIPCALYPIPILQEGRRGETEAATRIKRLKQLEDRDPTMASMYELHVMRRMTVTAGKRNDSLAELVPYLHRAVGGAVAERLVGLALEINQGVYHGTMAEHMQSLKSLWDGCNNRYAAELSPNEASIYGALDRDEQAAFRIMRDLAIAGGGQFFMGCDQLQQRLGCGNGWRLLTRFSRGYGIICQVRPGQKWEKGSRAQAATWRWNFPLPAAASAA